MSVDLRLGDCLDFPHVLCDMIITDPPFPNYYAIEYQYRDGILDFLKDYSCRQLIFWSARVEFPLDYTAVHIWDKKTGNKTTQYDRIFERNGQKNYQIFRHYFINSTVAAQMTGDVFTGHKSQKPIKLMAELIEKFSKDGNVIYDPFMGSGSTGVAAVRLGRGFVGREINPEYFAIAERRIAEAQAQMVMPL